MLLGASYKFVKEVIMLLASAVLHSARITLADQAVIRWPNSDLLSFLNDGLSALAIKTDFSKEKVYIAVEHNIAKYDISDIAIKIDEVRYLNKPMEAKRGPQMDQISTTWEDDIGLEPKYVIFDNMRPGTFKIYPKVTEGAANIIVQNSPYGGLIDIECTDELASIPSIDNIAFSDIKYLSIYYTAKPPTITDISNSIDIGSVWLPALSAYVAGMALMSDKDTQSRNMGAEQLSLFSSYVDSYDEKEKMQNNSMTVRFMGYRGFQ